VGELRAAVNAMAAASASASTNVQYVALPVEREQSDVAALVQSELTKSTKAAKGGWALGILFIILVYLTTCTPSDVLINTNDCNVSVALFNFNRCL
jgi:hypothetical protein